MAIKFLRRYGLALVGTLAVVSAMPNLCIATDSVDQSDKNSQQSSTGLSEIIVTAQKRSENLMDVPSAISAISGDVLQSLHVSSLADMVGFVPGLSITDGGAPGARLIEIRGLSTNYYPTTGPLVGTYIDDLPVGGSTGTGWGALFGLDLNPYDIDRVEVLKGPQGTLYGANAMGGLVKYVLKKPDLENTQISVGADVSDINGGNKAGWAVRGAVSLPIVTDKLALRLSGSDKYTPGYIDNVTTGATDVNHSTETGGRATLLWLITGDLSVQATALAQDVHAANLSAVTFSTLPDGSLQPLAGAYKLASYFPEEDRQSTRIYSLEVDWDFHVATLTSTTGWSRIDNSQSNDVTAGFGPYTPGYPDALANYQPISEFTKFVEEVRLASPQNQRVQWMLGGYFSNEKTHYTEIISPFTPEYAPLPINILDFGETDNKFKETAGFANVTYKFSDLFDLSAGVRHSSYDESACIDRAEGVFWYGAVLGCNNLPSTPVSVWMGNASLHISRDMLAYARVSTGYRPGSGCPTCGVPAEGIPGVVNPDKTTNYEMGFKGSFLNRRLEVQFAAFHINWTDIQVTQLTAQGLVYPGNGGTAVSNGLEATIAYQVTDNLRLSSALGYTDAHLTQDAPGAGGKDGDQLPGSPRFTGSLIADYRRPIDDAKSILFGGAYRYKDGVVNQFAHVTQLVPPGSPFPTGPQNIVDLYAGVAMRAMTLRLYTTNVFNNQSYAGLLFVDSIAMPNFVPVTPRTIGLSIDYQFK